MNGLAKSLSLCLVLVLAVSVLFSVAVPIDAQTVPQPSVPEFTVKFVNASHTEFTPNIYTGALEGKEVGDNSIVITITNQPFSYSGYQLFYNVRCKLHFGGDDWAEFYPLEDSAISYYGGDATYDKFIENGVQPSNLAYTILSYSVKPTIFHEKSGYDIYLHDGDVNFEDEVIGIGLPYGTQLDFQVEAQVGHPSSKMVIEHPLYPSNGAHMEPAIGYDLSSGWSDTKTTVIGQNIASAQPSPTVPEFPTLIILPLFIAVPVITAMIYRKKQFAKIK